MKIYGINIGSIENWKIDQSRPYSPSTTHTGIDIIAHPWTDVCDASGDDPVYLGGGESTTAANTATQRPLYAKDMFVSMRLSY